VTQLILSAAVFVLTLALMFVRPRDLSEAASAGIGAILMLLLRLATPRDVLDVLGETANVLLFLFGMMLVTCVAERGGVFDALAVIAARSARGSGRLLLINVFLLGALITTFLSLDVTVIVLTPIVYAVTTRLDVDPLPYLFACAFVANTASLFLPVSNLTNILMYDLLHLSFARFLAVMFLPNLAALAVNVAIFFALFRERIAARFATRLDAQERPPGFIVAAIGLVAVLVGLLVCGFRAVPLAIPALVGAVALGGVALGRRMVAPRALARSVAWPLFPFVIAMFVVIRGVERAWLPYHGTLPTGSGLPTLLGIAFGTAAGANLINNIPMVAAMIRLLQAVTPIPEPAAFATLIGTNIGPSVITFGSLATMLWLALVRTRGLDVSARAYLRVGLITTPPMLLAATLVLCAVLRFF
jgi:arsenical pump membrane protein